MRTSRFLRAWAGAAAGVAIVGGAAVAVPATASTGSTTAAGQAYRAERVCSAPSPGHATCFAMKLVKVKTGTPESRTLTSHPGYTTGPAGGFTPTDLASAYGVTPTTKVTQTVGIVDAFNDPNALKDLNTFDAKYGLKKETTTTFKKVSQTGSTTALPTSNSGWAGEISLDLDSVRGLCNTCKIVLVEATSSAFTNFEVAEDEAVKLGATEISNSYGGGESGTIPAAELSAYNHPGVVITASTGDDGYFAWDVINNDSGDSANAPEIPSSLNTVVAVGGTSLYLNNAGTRSGETVWNENGPSDVDGDELGSKMGATGGGCSTEVTAQTWQQDVANYSLTECGKKRAAADISALADPYTGYDIYDSYDATGWETYGGTSLASPLIAAMWALAGGSGGVNYPSMSLYGHFKSAAATTVNDITTGGNGLCGGAPAQGCANFLFGGTAPNTAGLGILDCAWVGETAKLSAGTRACDAATGYDAPSGIGTPKGLAVFKAMAPAAVISAAVRGSAASFSAVGSSDPFPGGKIVSYRWSFGDGTTAAGPLAAHTFSSAGAAIVTLTVTDNYGRQATSNVTKVMA